MATLASLISSIRTTASGPLMRKYIADAFETVNDALETAKDAYKVSEVTAANRTYNAGSSLKRTVSASLSGYTPIGVLSFNSSMPELTFSEVALNGANIEYTVFNRGTASVTGTITFTVLFKNNNS